MIAQVGGPAVPAIEWMWLIPAIPLVAAGTQPLRRPTPREGRGLARIGRGGLVVPPRSSGPSSSSWGRERTSVSSSSTCSTGSRSGSFNVGVDLRLDVLSATMILVVTGIGLLIHVYAIGYMEGDPRYGRFFAYLNLFVFFMLLLVLADNYLLLYVGWEGVGLCSYLLIGFWFEKTENASAAKKAFVTTRIGDTADADRSRADRGEVRLARLRRGPRRAGGDDREGDGDGDLAAPVRRGDREVRADPTPRLAAGRDGRPHAGLGADPRRDDGDGRRLPRRAERAALRALRASP